jgi:hypothetical protein
MAADASQQGSRVSVNHWRASRIHLHHHNVTVPWTSILLGLMAALVLMMPATYRAGTESSHPHTVLQPMIDRATGRPHHHPGDTHVHRHTAEASHAGALSPFAPPGIPLNVLQTPDRAHVAYTPMQPDAEAPSIANMKPTLDQPLILATMIGMLVLAAVVVTRRSAWERVRFPGACAIAPDIPPPRPISVPTAL